MNDDSISIYQESKIKLYSRSERLASIIEKRVSLHKELANRQRENTELRLEINQLQALASIGTIMCMVAHELNNLLTPVGSYATLALNNSDDRPLTEKALRKAVRNCERASRIMESMLAMTNGQMQEKKDVRLIVLVEDVFACLSRDFVKDGITVEIRVPDDLTIRVNPVHIEHVLINLIVNAREAMLPGGGILTIKGQERRDAVEIEVSDTGRGIDTGDLERIFEPFFTTKAHEKSSSERKCFGLGLAFCKRIADEHNGSIRVESEAGKRTAFKVTLPKRPQGSSK